MRNFAKMVGWAGTITWGLFLILATWHGGCPVDFEVPWYMNVLAPGALGLAFLAFLMLTLTDFEVE